MTEKQKRRVKRITRDSVLFVVGIAGIIYETTAHDLERPFLLMVFAGMVGLPAFIPKNEPPSIEPPNDDK